MEGRWMKGEIKRSKVHGKVLMLYTEGKEKYKLILMEKKRKISLQISQHAGSKSKSPENVIQQNVHMYMDGKES